MRALAALALCACTGTVGTIQLELATAPGSHVLDAVEQLRLTITDPHQVIEATRTGSGFSLALEIDAGTTPGALIVEGFDAAGALVACGQAPPFPLAAINAHIVVYVAAPRSIAVAPAAFATPLGEVSGTALSYGAVLAGGRDAAGTPSTLIAVYDAFDHTLIEGVPLPAPRAGLAIAAGVGGGVFLFGGTGADGKPTGTLWRFDTTVPPSGSFLTLGDVHDFARTGQTLVPIGPDVYIVTGTPALEVRTGMVEERLDVPGLPAAAAAVIADRTLTAIFAGTTLVRYRGGQFDTLSGTGRTGATATALPRGRIAVIGDDPATSHDALVIDGTAGTVSVIPGVIATPRRSPVLAATSRHLVIAGGSDDGGAPVATAEVLDAATLAPLAILPILPRSGGFAIALPNDQVLLGGGTPAAAELELFTPEPPP